jgi:hypothetical protein
MWRRVDRTDLIIGAVFITIGSFAMPNVATAVFGGFFIAGGFVIGTAVGRAARG